MDDKKLEQIIRQIDTEVEPPEGLKVKILGEVLASAGCEEQLNLSGWEKFFFKNPLRAACVLSIVISGALWAVMGNGYASFFINLAGNR